MQRTFFLCRRQHGFTLIELLIVVAIIAILAVIAVPNFLDAQVRSKTSRAKADMRSITTAIESYRTDYGGYPFLSDAMSMSNFLTDSNLISSTVSGYLNYQKGGDTYSTGYSLVKFMWGAAFTTPIAYMTSLPMDPFSVREGGIYGGGKTGYLFVCISSAVRACQMFPNVWAKNYRIDTSGNYFTNGSGTGSTAPTVPLQDPYPWTPVQDGAGGNKGTTYYVSWLLSSMGPCGTPIDSWQFFANWRYYQLAHKDSTIPKTSYSAKPGTDVNTAQIYWWQPPYDPTNGTTSVGKIFRSSAGQLN